MQSDSVFHIDHSVLENQDEYHSSILGAGFTLNS